MVVDRGPGDTAQVEVVVRAQADGCRRIGHRVEVEADVRASESVSRLHVEVARVAGVAVGACQLERDAVVFGGARPPAQPESGMAAVQVVGRKIGVEPVGNAIEFEPGARHAVGIATDQAVEMRVGVEVVRDGGAAEEHVREVAPSVGHLDPGHDAAEFDHLGGQLAGVDPESQEVGVGLEDFDQGARGVRPRSESSRGTRRRVVRRTARRASSRRPDR